MSEMEDWLNEPTVEEKPKKGRKRLMIAVVVTVLIMVVALVTWYALREMNQEPSEPDCVDLCMDSHCVLGSADFEQMCEAARQRANDPSNPQPGRNVTDEDCMVLCRMLCESECKNET